MRAILHYTEPGDIVLDGFAGSGMTGVAAQICGHPDVDFKQLIENECRTHGRNKPKWGARRAVLNDLSPAATFIAHGYNLPFPADAFTEAATRILEELETELGWMYETIHSDGKTKGRINYTVWSENFACPDCGKLVVFSDEALDQPTKRVRDSFPCPKCGSDLTKDKLQRVMETLIDPATGSPYRRVKFSPVLINYNVRGKKFEKKPDAKDIELLGRIARLPYIGLFPPTHSRSTRCIMAHDWHPRASRIFIICSYLVALMYSENYGPRRAAKKTTLFVHLSYSLQNRRFGGCPFSQGMGLRTSRR